MEAPVDSSDNEEGSDESLLLPEEYEEEVDINIHFHCEHCVKMGRCQERPKPGWACEIDYCPNGCGHRSVEWRWFAYKRCCVIHLPVWFSCNLCFHLLQIFV